MMPAAGGPGTVAPRAGARIETWCVRRGRCDARQSLPARERGSKHRVAHPARTWPRSRSPRGSADRNVAAAQFGKAGVSRSPRGSADRNTFDLFNGPNSYGRSPRGSADRNIAVGGQSIPYYRSLPARERGSKQMRLARAGTPAACRSPRGSADRNVHKIAVLFCVWGSLPARERGSKRNLTRLK